jgi:multidrug efflux pump subunit AcrA (membrane-fusion protein)
MPLRSAKVRDDLEFFEQEVDDDTVVVVRDPIRGTYFRFNVLQAGMLRALDGVRTPVQIAEQLSEEFEVEVPPAAAERFVVRARELMLLDVASYRQAGAKARKRLARALRRGRFRLREVVRDEQRALARVESAESAMFMAALRQLDRGDPIAAAEYLTAVLEINPDNPRARQLHGLVQEAFVRAAGTGTDFPSFRLFNPSRLLGWLSRTFGRFLFSPWGVLVMAVYVCVGIHFLTTIRFSDLQIDLQSILVAFVATRVSLLVHELGHGLACVYYGGRVTEVGVILFYYVTFGAYCDTSSSYLFTNRRHKVIVQIAGQTASTVYIATQAIVLALLNPDLPVYQGLLLTLVVELTLGFVTLIPFVKNDGYYAICDYFDLPNLRERSFRVASAWLQRRFLGLSPEVEELSPRTRRWFAIYAGACLAFTAAFLYWGIFRLTAPLIEWQGGWGLAVALLFIAFVLRRFVYRPLVAFGRLLVHERRAIFTLRRTALLVAVIVLAAAPWAIRWPVLVDAEFVLVPVDRAHVRVSTPGIVEQIHVREGQAVKAGEELARLRNDPLRARREQVEEELKMTEARLAQLKHGARSEEIDIARQHFALAAGVMAKSSSDAALKRKLARHGLARGADADQAVRAARMDRSMASAAAADLALMRAGFLPEEIGAVEAQRSGLQAQLVQLRLEEERLVLRSPIAGVVVTPHIEDRLHAYLQSGEQMAEVQDQREFVAELTLPPWAPLALISRGDRIALRPYASPDREIATALGRTREAAEPAAASVYGDTQVTAISAPVGVERGRGGMRGQARVYGERRSLAYAYIYLPLRRFFSIRLWAIW